jgi:soluble lytic murein transglycosylase-like protein
MTLKALVSQRLGFSRFCVSVFIGAFCGVAVVCGPADRANAQVIEIGAQGALTVYDGPAVFTANGVAAIRRPTAPTAPAPRLTAAPPHLRRAISDAAQASDLSAALIAAIAWRESNFKALAVSRAGAVGEMQLLPRTARQLGVDPRVSRQNVAGGAAYVRSLLRRYDGDLIKTLAAYNAGPEAVDRYGGVPPFKETKAYVAAGELGRRGPDERSPRGWGRTSHRPVGRQ